MALCQQDSAQKFRCSNIQRVQVIEKNHLLFNKVKSPFYSNTHVYCWAIPLYSTYTFFYNFASDQIRSFVTTISKISTEYITNHSNLILFICFNAMQAIIVYQIKKKKGFLFFSLFISFCCYSSSLLSFIFLYIYTIFKFFVPVLEMIVKNFAFFFPILFVACINLPSGHLYFFFLCHQPFFFLSIIISFHYFIL